MQSRLFLALVIATSFSSCATYRSGATPDDVYYSPERRINRFEENRDERSTVSTEDYRLRQQIRDARLRTFDDDFYWNQNWQMGNNWVNRPVWGNGWHGFGSPVNFWNNPFYCIPGTNFVISTPGKGNVIKTSPRYTPSITTLNNNQPRNAGTTSGGKFGTRSSGNGSRFFGGATNQSGSSFRYNYPSGGSGNSWNGSSGGRGSRTFSTGSSSGSRSSGSSGTRSRRN